MLSYAVIGAVIRYGGCVDYKFHPSNLFGNWIHFLSAIQKEKKIAQPLKLMCLIWLVIVMSLVSFAAQGQVLPGAPSSRIMLSSEWDSLWH